jgi:hypothetical protein
VEHGTRHMHACMPSRTPPPDTPPHVYRAAWTFEDLKLVLAQHNVMNDGWLSNTPFKTPKGVMKYRLGDV